MTTVHRNRLMLFGLAATVAGFSGCKKYPEGPAISLKSKQARLVGDWELADGTYHSSNNELFFEFEDDGDFTFRGSQSFYGYSNNFNYSGGWEFSSNKEELEIEIDGGGKVDYEILRLTSDELFLEDEDGSDWEFEKQ